MKFRRSDLKADLNDIIKIAFNFTKITFNLAKIISLE